MKKIILIVAMAVMPLVGFSQSIFDKFEDLDNVTSVIVSPGMFNLLSKIDIDVDDKEAKEFISIAKSMKSLKVFITEDKGVSTDMKSVVNKYLKSSSLEELMRIKDDDTNIKFYIKSGKDSDHVSELLMFISGLENVNVKAADMNVETVLVSLTGDIDLNKINTLTSKMNLPQELNKVNKKNK